MKEPELLRSFSYEKALASLRGSDTLFARASAVLLTKKPEQFPSSVEATIILAEKLDTAPGAAPAVVPGNESPRSANSVTIAGTLERDPQILTNEATGKERAVVRIKETSPGYNFEKDGATVTVPDKNRYRSATIVGPAVDAVRNLEQGDELTVRGRLETFTDPETRRDRVGIRAFSAIPGISDELRAAPNQVALAGTVANDPQLRPNLGNPNLTSLNYTLETFGKNPEALAIREFGADVSDFAAERQKGAELELNGRFTEAVFQGRNGQVRTYSISTTSDEVQTIARAQQRDTQKERDPQTVREDLTPDSERGPDLQRAEGGGFTEMFDRAARGQLAAKFQLEVNNTVVGAAEQTSVVNVLQAVETATYLDPQSTRTMLDRIAAQIGDQQPEVVKALESVYETGLEAYLKGGGDSKALGQLSEARTADIAAPGPVDFEALTRTIARTDWNFESSDIPWEQGRSEVRNTLKAVIEAAQSDPEGTSKLVERFADANPEAEYVVKSLRSAVRGQLEPALEPAADVKSLPVYTPSSVDTIDRREDFKLSIDQTIRVLGRSEDGERVFGRNGAAVLSVNRDAFDEPPKLDDTVTISRVDGKDVARSAARNVGLEV